MEFRDNQEKGRMTATEVSVQLVSVGWSVCWLFKSKMEKLLSLWRPLTIVLSPGTLGHGHAGHEVGSHRLRHSRPWLTSSLRHGAVVSWCMGTWWCPWGGGHWTLVGDFWLLCRLRQVASAFWASVSFSVKGLLVSASNYVGSLEHARHIILKHILLLRRPLPQTRYVTWDKLCCVGDWALVLMYKMWCFELQSLLSLK
jgi:hypothetical protein